jgi:hypothetical protein
MHETPTLFPPTPPMSVRHRCTLIATLFLYQESVAAVSKSVRTMVGQFVATDVVSRPCQPTVTGAASSSQPAWTSDDENDYIFSLREGYFFLD